MTRRAACVYLAYLPSFFELFVCSGFCKFIEIYNENSVYHYIVDNRDRDSRYKAVNLYIIFNEVRN